MKKALHICLFISIFIIFLCQGIIIYNVVTNKNNYIDLSNVDTLSSNVILNNKAKNNLKVDINGINPGDNKEYIIYINTKNKTNNINFNILKQEDNIIYNFITITIKTNQETFKIPGNEINKKYTLSFNQQEKTPITICFSLSKDAGNEISLSQATILMEVNINN